MMMPFFVGRVSPLPANVPQVISVDVRSFLKNRACQGLVQPATAAITGLPTITNSLQSFNGLSTIFDYSSLPSCPIYSSSPPAYGIIVVPKAGTYQISSYGAPGGHSPYALPCYIYYSWTFESLKLFIFFYVLWYALTFFDAHIFFLFGMNP